MRRHGCLSNQQSMAALFYKKEGERNMANLTLIDRLQLVKAGYKAKQIEEMRIKDAEIPATEEPAANTSEGEAEPEQAKEEKVEEPSAETDAPDYKTMFENLQKEYAETQKKLDAAQRANASRDVSGNVQKEDSQTKLNNIFKEIIS